MSKVRALVTDIVHFLTTEVRRSPAIGSVGSWSIDFLTAALKSQKTVYIMVAQLRQMLRLVTVRKTTQHIVSTKATGNTASNPGEKGLQGLLQMTGTLAWE